MQNEVTKRFILIHDELRSKCIVSSSRQFALSLDTTPQQLNLILKGKRDASVSLIQRVIEVFRVCPIYIMTGHGEMFADCDGQPTICNDQNIGYIPVAAHAGMGNQFYETVQEDEIEYFSIPGYHAERGEHRCFDIIGDSMEPVLFGGDKVVCSLVDTSYGFKAIKDHLVYVIITHEDIYVKRVMNQISESGELILISDNSFYNPRRLDASEIKAMYQVNYVIRMFMPNPKNIKNDLQSEIDEMKSVIQLQSDHINTLNKSMERFLRMNRGHA